MKIKEYIKKYLEITLGILLLDIGYYFFFTPTNLVTGGVMGIGLLLQNYLPIPTSMFILIVNVIILIISFFTLGKDFFLKTIYATVLSPLILLILESTCDTNYFIQNVNENKYLIAAICGTLLSALGLGLCFRNNGCTGGMDVIQKMMVKYLRVPYSLTMYLTDWVVVFLGGFLSINGLWFEGGKIIYNLEPVVYGIICVLFVGIIVDYVALHGRSRRTAFIITKKPEEIKKAIFESIDRGVTECDVRGGFTKDDKVMLICTMNKNEAYRFSDIINSIDNEAFTFFTSAKEVRGNYEKGRGLF